jgi:hypothetical protein
MVFDTAKLEAFLSHIELSPNHYQTVEHCGRRTSVAELILGTTHEPKPTKPVCQQSPQPTKTMT